MSINQNIPGPKIYGNIDLSGNTLNAFSITASTYYSGSTPLSQIFATAQSTYLPTSQIAYGNSSSGITGNINFQYTDSQLFVRRDGSALVIKPDTEVGFTAFGHYAEGFGILAQDNAVNFYNNGGGIPIARFSLNANGSTIYTDTKIQGKLTASSITGTTVSANTFFIETGGKIQSENFNYVNDKLTVKTTTLGGTIYAENSSYSLAGDGPIVVSDNLGGRKLGLGYSPNSTDFIWSAAEGMYLKGHGQYGVFIDNNGINNGSLHVSGKFRVGDLNFNTGYHLEVSGTSLLVGQTKIVDLANANNRIVEANSGGTLSASKTIVTAYITSNTVKSQLTASTNWNYLGVYTGSTISGTYQGQKHYDANYFYEAVEDNLFIRLIRA